MKAIHTKVEHKLAQVKLLLPSLGLTSITAISALVLSSSISSAASNIIPATIKVLEACSITASDNGEGNIDNPFEAIGGTYESSVKQSTLNLLCNDNNGYSLYAVGYSNNTEGNTDLIGATTGNTIPTGIVTDASISNWSFKLTPVEGTYTPTILSDTNGSFSSNHVIPSTTTKLATYTDAINVSTPSTITVDYAVGLSTYQEPDTYTGKIKYTLVHPNFANVNGKNIITIATTGNATGFTIDGTAYENGDTLELVPDGTTHTIVASTSDFNEGYEFDSWSATGGVALADASSSTTTFTLAGDGTLTLNGKQSCQSSLSGSMQDFDPSGLCDGVTSGTLTDARDSNAYTVAKIGSLWWMTKNLMLGKSTTTALTSSTSNVSSSGYTLPASSTSGFSGYTAQNIYVPATTTCSSSSACYGYYTYAAATAGSNPSSGASSYDICPKGWRLPTQAEFNTLKGTYTTGATLTASPWYGVYSGYYGGGSFYNGGSFGGYWSSTADGSYYAYYLYFDNSSAAVVGNTKNLGFAVRCVAKS
ncbi:hypothetical protein IJJ37_03110 [Candidatus Saccharibacteria bacterium]|nr:hypothetical protein [Candidatus Saccharibacteria bacterium]